jgi:hypothetical protein
VKTRVSDSHLFHEDLEPDTDPHLDMDPDRKLDFFMVENSKRIFIYFLKHFLKYEKKFETLLLFPFKKSEKKVNFEFKFWF